MLSAQLSCAKSASFGFDHLLMPKLFDNFFLCITQQEKLFSQIFLKKTTFAEIIHMNMKRTSRKAKHMLGSGH